MSDDKPPKPQYAVWMDRVNLGTAEVPRWHWCCVDDVPLDPRDGGHTGYDTAAWYPNNEGSGSWLPTLDFECFGVLEAFMRWQTAEIAKLRAAAEAVKDKARIAEREECIRDIRAVRSKLSYWDARRPIEVLDELMVSIRNRRTT